MPSRLHLVYHEARHQLGDRTQWTPERLLSMLEQAQKLGQQCNNCAKQQALLNRS